MCSAARRQASRSSSVVRALAAELAVKRTSIADPTASTVTNEGLSARSAATIRSAVVASGNDPWRRILSSIPVPSDSGAVMRSLLGPARRARG